MQGIGLGWAGLGLPLSQNDAGVQVEAVFSVPLRRFLEAGPEYSSRDVEWQPGVPYRLHYFDYEYRGSTYCIWGLTAGDDAAVPATVVNGRKLCAGLGVHWFWAVNAHRVCALPCRHADCHRGEGVWTGASFSAQSP